MKLEGRYCPLKRLVEVVILHIRVQFVYKPLYIQLIYFKKMPPILLDINSSKSKIVLLEKQKFSKAD